MPIRPPSPPGSTRSLSPVDWARWLACLWVLWSLQVRCHAQDWPQFLGPGRDGVYAATNLAPKWPQEGPTRLWSREVGAGFSGPVISQNHLILHHRSNDVTVVECMHPLTGKTVWATRLPTRYRDDFGFDDGPRATPAIADGRVFVFGAEGLAAALDLKTGAVAWQKDTAAEVGARKGFFGLAASPLALGSAVFLNTGGGEEAEIIALDQATGRLLWKQGGDEASYASPIRVTLGGTDRILLAGRNAVKLLDPVSGRLLASHPFKPPVNASVTAATPLVRGDEFFFSASYGLGALMLRWTGSGFSTVWSGDEVLSNHYATSVRHKEHLYGFDGRQEEGCLLRCVEWSTGKVRWTQEGLRAGTVLIAGSDLLVLTEQGELLRAAALPSGFKVLERAQILPFQVRAHPALAHGILYARSKSRLGAFDLRAQSVTPPKP